MIVCYTGFKGIILAFQLAGLKQLLCTVCSYQTKAVAKLLITCIISLLFKNSLLFKLLSTCKPRKKHSQRTQLADV